MLTHKTGINTGFWWIRLIDANYDKCLCKSSIFWVFAVKLITKLVDCELYTSLLLLSSRRDTYIIALLLLLKFRSCNRRLSFIGTIDTFFFLVYYFIYYCNYKLKIIICIHLYVYIIKVIVSPWCRRSRWFFRHCSSHHRHRFSFFCHVFFLGYTVFVVFGLNYHPNLKYCIILPL